MNHFQSYFHKFFVRNSKLTRHSNLVSFYEKNIDRNRTRVLIACMPKSGSTFLTEMLRHYLQFPAQDIAVGYGRTEQEVNWLKLDSVIDSDALFTQQHVRANELTLKAIRLFNIRTIVLIRNLFDVVISFRDHLIKESTHFPMAYVDNSFAQWKDRQQYEFVIDLMIPWYLNFLGTWIEAGTQKDIPLLWLNYADWIGDPEATLKQIDTFCGLSHSTDAAVQAVARARQGGIRLNVGRTGRGRELLDSDLQAKVNHLLSYYPAFDPYKAKLIGTGNSA